MAVCGGGGGVKKQNVQGLQEARTGHFWGALGRGRERGSCVRESRDGVREIEEQDTYLSPQPPRVL